MWRVTLIIGDTVRRQIFANMKCLRYSRLKSHRENMIRKNSLLLYTLRVCVSASHLDTWTCFVHRLAIVRGKSEELAMSILSTCRPARDMDSQARKEACLEWWHQLLNDPLMSMCVRQLQSLVGRRGRRIKTVWGDEGQDRGVCLHAKTV